MERTGPEHNSLERRAKESESYEPFMPGLPKKLARQLSAHHHRSALTSATARLLRFESENSA